MVKDVITEDFDWQFSQGMGDVTEDEATTQGHSQYSKAEGKAVLLENRLFQVDNFADGNIHAGGTIVGFSFTPQAQYTKGEGGKLVLLDGDKIEGLTINGINSKGNPDTSIVTLTIKAKQHTVKGS